MLRLYYLHFVNFNKSKQRHNFIISIINVFINRRVKQKKKIKRTELVILFRKFLLFGRIKFCFLGGSRY
jgi:hypothetical protein